MDSTGKEGLSGLRALCDARSTIQKTRIQFGNRVSAIESGRDTSDPITLDALKRALTTFELAEKDLDGTIRDKAVDLEIVQAAICVKGVGAVSVGPIIGMIDIVKADTVSSLWKYAGYAVDVDENGVGTGQRLRRGQKSSYNVALKTACYRLATSLMRTGSPYREIYDEAKLEYLNRGWTKSHAHAASIRKMIKIFLQHLWISWRTLEGLPISQPYAHDVMNHTHYITPEMMGWPPLRV